MKPFSKKQLKADLKEYSNNETKDMNLWIIQHPDLMRSVIEASQKASSEEDLEVFIFALLNPIAVDLGISTDVRWHELGYAWFNTTRGNWPMKEVNPSKSKNIDIQNLPTFDKKQKLDELLEQLSAETDPIKQEKIKKHIEHVKRAKLLKAGKGYGEEAICPTCGEYKPTDFSPAELKEREWECLECETKRSKGEVPKDPGSEPISKYHPTYEFLVRLVKLLSKTIPEAIPEIKQLSLQHPFQTVADIEYLTTQIWNLATTKYNIPREWLIKKLPEKKGSLNKKAETIEISTTYSRGKFPVLIDPTSDQMEELIRKSNYDELRYLEGKGGSMYVWDAYRSTHAEVAKELHFKGFDVDENSPRGIFSEREVFASLNKKAEAEGYWIQPNGEIIDVTETTHDEWLLENRQFDDLPKGVSEAIESGWVRVMSIPGQTAFNIDSLSNPPKILDNLAYKFDTHRWVVADATGAFVIVDNPKKSFSEEIRRAVIKQKRTTKADLWPAQEQAGDMLSHDHNSLSYNPLQEPDTSVSGPNLNDIKTDTIWDIIVDKFFTHRERWSSVVKVLKEANPSITDEDIKSLKDRVRKSLDNQMGINASKKIAGNVFDLGKARIYKNPNFQHIKKLLEKSKDHSLRGLIDPLTNDLYMWDAWDADHDQLARYVGIELDEDMWEAYVWIVGDDSGINAVLGKQRQLKGNSPKQAKKKLNIDKVIKILDSKEPKVVHVDTKNYKLELADGTSLTFDEAIKKAMEMDKEGVFSGAEFSTTEFNVNPTLDNGPFSSPEDHGAKPQEQPFPNTGWLPADDENKDEQPWSNIASNLNRPFSKKAYYSDVFNVVIHDSQIRQYFEDRGIDITKINQMLPDLDINYWNKNSPVQIGVNEESTIGQLEQENPGYKFGKQYAAYYQQSTKQIYVNPTLTLSNARSTIIHELEHALQDNTGILFPVEKWINTPYDIRTHEWGAELSTIRSFKNKGYSLEQIFKFYLNKAKKAGGYPDDATELDATKKNQIEQLYELADEVEPQSVVSKKELNKQARYDQPYWIDPAGKEYKLSNDTHESWAENNQKLLKSKYGVDFIKMSKRDSASSFLMLNGWTRAAISETIIVFTRENLNNLDVLDNFVAEHWEKDRFHYILLETISDQKSWQITEPFPSLASAKKDEVTSTGLGMYGSIKQASSIEDVGGTKVYVDPTWEQAKGLLNNSKEKNLRGIVDPWTGGSLYIWDSYSLTHEDVIRALGLGIEPYPEEEEYSDLLSQMNDEAGLRWMFNMQQKVRNSSSKKKADALDEILKLVNETGGATWNLSQGNMSGTDNYSVSTHPELSLILDHAPFKEELSEYVKANSTNGDGIGIWKDSSSGKWYLDVVSTIPNKEEAIELGRKHNQIAIWDLKNNQEIPIGGTGEKIASVEMLETNFGPDIKVLRNPTVEEAVALLQTSKYKDLRYGTSDPDLWMWDAYYLEHADAAQGLGLEDFERRGDVTTPKEIQKVIEKYVYIMAKKTFCKKEAEESLLTQDQQNQVASVSSPIYNLALNNYAEAVKRGHSKDRSLAYAVDSVKNLEEIDEKKLVELINTYLKGLI